jgi:hypothetical protein
MDVINALPALRATAVQSNVITTRKFIAYREILAVAEKKQPRLQLRLPLPIVCRNCFSAVLTVVRKQLLAAIAFPLPPLARLIVFMAAILIPSPVLFLLQLDTKLNQLYIQP